MAVLNELSDRDRGQALLHVPRHSVESVFSAYCEWFAQVSPEPFQSLVSVVPDLDFQVFQQACMAFPGMTWEVWAEQVHMASGDHGLRHELGRALTHSLAGPTRRTLHFG